jgi:hypothetical protein
VGIIKNINLNLIEDSLEEIVGLSFQTKIFQELHEVIIKQIKINKSSFSSGNISKDVYNKNKIILENERKKLVGKINEITEKIQKVNENIQKIIIDYKI